MNDIALVRLSKNVELSRERREVRTICLPTEASEQIENLTGVSATLIIAGWGGTENTTDKKMNDNLMKANINYFPNENCTVSFADMRRKFKSFNAFVDDKQMCAVGKLNKKIDV